MRAIIVFLLLNPLSFLSLVGCAQAPPSSKAMMEPADAAGSGANCALHLSGNTSSALSLPSCRELSFANRDGSDGGAPDVVLNFHWSAAGLRAVAWRSGSGHRPRSAAVHAAPATDCGAGEVEDLLVEF